MAEKWGTDKAKPEVVGPPRRGLSKAERARKARNDRKRRVTRGFSLTALIVVLIGAVFLGSKLWHGMSGSAGDYAGDGVADVVIQVHDGDSTTAIAKTLQDQKVVATIKAFVDAAHKNEEISAIQPGFYKLRTEIPAASAVERLVDPESRVGKLTIPEGRQLDDTADVKTKAITEGIFTLISQASCVELDGEKRCVPADELRAAAQTAPAAALAVPDWAAGPVAAMPNDHRRLEGLIAPGTWNVDPAGKAQDILSTLIAGSATVYTQSGLLDTAAAMQMSPYQILTVGSLVQREAKPQDFDKVARVIYNRLAEHRKLEFDSTVNYPLDRQEVATTDDDRGKTTPWNTYMSQGLPQTPICSPGTDALAAAEHPAAGDWLYFVTIDLQGTTLFTRDYDQHLANIEQAQHNGVLDSAR
ncbi:endolytic transglycosylase MltG [Mycobacterium sp. NPDC050441]|uniref:endolytic transglycosylase MltG n=1 Tax=Mycobacterium sp. NPDC050441 TaxID=3155403 RepID=UPI0033D2E57C